MNCKKCGNNVQENEKFCLSCGTGFEVENKTFIMTDSAENAPLQKTTEESVSEDFPSRTPFSPPFQTTSSSFPADGIWSKDDPNLQTENPARITAREEWRKQQLNKAFYNGIFAVAFSVWTLIVVFTEMFTNNSFWVLIFIVADFACSIPAILQALRGRGHCRKKFLASMIMGIASTAASIFALAWWLAT